VGPLTRRRVTAFLALTSAAIIGGVDFFGGFISRRLPPVRVAALVQVAGLVCAVPAALLYDWDRVTTGDVLWSLASGATVGLGLGLFYTALARGLISLVAPVTGAVGATIPVVWDFARGEIPGALAVVGIVLAIAAIVIVSLATGAPGSEDMRAILLGTVAGVLFGVFFVTYSLTDPEAGLWPVPISRIASAAVLLVAAVVLTRGVRLPMRASPPIVLLGVLEVFAAAMLLVALQRGPVSVAAVLGSFYPVTTVLLAAVVLHERLTRSQTAGVVLALVAIALVSTG
jgi:drug/metabolite transporter (DMT)-like permease